MSIVVRPATASDAVQWVELARAYLGDGYPAAQVYEPEWVATQLEAVPGQETWVAEVEGLLRASLTLLAPLSQNTNPITNLGRNLNHPCSYEDGSAAALLAKINELASARGHLQVARILASENQQQTLFERAGYTCVGFQPAKHLRRTRESVLVYVRIEQPSAMSRLPVSESLPLVSELATFVLKRLGITPPQVTRDGTTGYPLLSELVFHECSYDDFELWRLQAQLASPPVEVSSGYNLGWGILRLPTEKPPRTLLAQADDKIVAGLSFLYDEYDRCVRVADAFATDDLSPGALLNYVVKMAQEKFSALYIETDILMTAPRMLKSADQLGFVPVAYMPAFYFENGHCADVVKMVKLNQIFALETMQLTPQAAMVAEIVDANFEEQKVGLAIISMLRGLRIFTGLGEGELRKIARLFTQKLFHAGDVIFKQGDRSQEAFVVMRGQVDILLDGEREPVSTLGKGQIFGEQAFLDSAPRAASAQASQASIVLIVQRGAFNDLVRHEPHLGLVVMRNIAVELSQKLRQADQMLAKTRA